MESMVLFTRKGMVRLFGLQRALLELDETSKPYFDAGESFTKDSKLPFDNSHTVVIESGKIRVAFSFSSVLKER
jgi:hypothetical protein